MLFFYEKNRSKEKTQRKKETKTRNPKKVKKIDKKERKEEERDIERESEKRGGQTRLRRNKGRHSKKTKNALFRGKTGFFY